MDIPATLSCLPLYSVGASLPHSLTTWATVSPLLLHILHKGDSVIVIIIIIIIIIIAGLEKKTVI